MANLREYYERALREFGAEQPGQCSQTLTLLSENAESSGPSAVPVYIVQYVKSAFSWPRLLPQQGI